MTSVLTDNLPLLAGAPNGIRKLRELILELAVRGKLVPQDAGDEPASELFKQMQNERKRLVADKAVRQGKPLPPIEENEVSFNLPENWIWVRLGQVGDWGAGATPARGNSSYYGGDTPWFKSGELVADYISESAEYVTELALKECSLRQNKAGDVLMAMYGATIGKTAILSVPATTNQAVCACTPYKGLLNTYLLLMLKAMKPNFIGQGAGGAQPNISREKIVATVAGLPPAREQQRIVARVDELMALCDTLETQQADAESAHARLVQALLDSLTQASDAQDFVTHWQRLSAHFDTLFTTESSIDALKQTLLQLAVMGKLVPQDPSDEPASDLLKRIAEKKSQLVSDRAIGKQRVLENVQEDEKPFSVPQSWEWAHFGDICAIRGELVRPEDFLDLRQVAPDCIEKGTGRLTESRTVKESGVRGPNSRFFAGQIVYSKIRPSLSKAVLVNFDGLCSADMYPLDAFIDPSFLLKQILSEVFLEQVRIAENRIKMPKLNQESLSAFVLPIPPLAEQHRIVAKVDELMALCDQLKTRLRQARDLNQQLATTLVERAVA